jgi:hypothetical protein
MAGTGQITAYSIAFGSGNLTQHAGVDFDPGVQFSDIHLAGRARRAKIIGDAAAAVFRVPTNNLLTILGKSNIIKYPFAESSGASFFFQQREEFATYSSGSNHYKIQCAKGFLLLNSLGVDGTGPAAANFEFHELWDGSAAMSIMTGGQALGGAAPAFVSQYYRGTVELDGSALVNVSGWSLDTGIALNKPLFGGDIGPRKASAEIVDPVIDIALASFADLVAHGIPQHGKEIASGLNLYLKRGDADDMRDADDEAILISSTAGHITPSRVSANGTSDGMLHLLYRPFDELAVNTAATHP